MRNYLEMLNAHLGSEHPPLQIEFTIAVNTYEVPTRQDAKGQEYYLYSLYISEIARLECVE